MIRIPAAGPVHVEGVTAALRAHLVPGLDRFVGDRYERLFPTADGPVLVRLRIRRDGVELDGDGDPTLVAAVADLLDLDHDPRQVSWLADDPLFAGRFREGLRVIGYPSAFEGALLTVLGQQVSVAALRTLAGRLVAGWGEPGPGGLIAFPLAAKVAAGDADALRTIGLTGAKAATMAQVAALFADGFTPTADDYQPRSPLGRLAGIGPWTLDYLRLRDGRDSDAFVPGDLVARRALGVRTPREADAIAERWRPFRGYALYQLWTAAAYLPLR